MATFLFDKTIFGPVYSRRLGISLGINLLPNKEKVCNFDCIYCECGRTKNTNNLNKLPSYDFIVKQLESRLKKINTDNTKIDTITFAGNGEPTLHPEFPKIIDNTIALRNKYTPEVKIAVLSNSTLIEDKAIFNALKKVDYNILKLDSVHNKTQNIINCPNSEFNLSKTIKKLKSFNGELIIQCMFFKGEYKKMKIDNSKEEEVIPLLNTIKEINPKMVMIYTIERDTPHKNFEKISKNRLDNIAERIKEIGLVVSVSY